MFGCFLCNLLYCRMNLSLFQSISKFIEIFIFYSICIYDFIFILFLCGVFVWRLIFIKYFFFSFRNLSKLNLPSIVRPVRAFSKIPTAVPSANKLSISFVSSFVWYLSLLPGFVFFTFPFDDSESFNSAWH